jgi:formylglycine-generating enzyme required for sulfatase activity
LHVRRIAHSFAIAAKPVTFEQFLRFQKKYSINRKYAPTDDCPVYGINWYMAAEYCNWLSKEERLPEKEWCYVPNPKGQYGEGMSAAPDFLKRIGYRLPTEAEWEYACRAGTESTRFFGNSDELLAKYSWYLGNSGNRNWPVGSLKPNDLGLFDVYGNIWQWCHDSYGSYVVDAEGKSADDGGADRAPVSEGVQRVLRGAWFGVPARNLRSAERSWSPPSSRLGGTGLRVARTLSDSQRTTPTAVHN